MSAHPEISPYDRLCWPDGLLLEYLQTGEHRRELVLYFGAENYTELTALARTVPSRRHGSQPASVWLVPGIMGSQLGALRGPGQPADLIWLDPSDIERGDLVKLRLDGPTVLLPLALVHHSYLRLWLRLLAAGFDARVFLYDWRLDILQSGAALAAELAKLGKKAMIVAHSLGGLVARAALTGPGAQLIERIVYLGTPNRGAAAAQLALLGHYPVVQRLARLDRRHDANQLATQIFSTFTSLQQLLPSHGDFWRRLPANDARVLTIAGHGFATCAAARQQHGEWQFQFTSDGDGTVTLASAQPDAGTCYLTNTLHGELPRTILLAQAIVELLQTGHTTLLPQAAASTPRAAAAQDAAWVPAADLPRISAAKIDWALMEPIERRIFLETLNDPPGTDARRRGGSAPDAGPELAGADYVARGRP
jgi:hypothetical protein